MAFFVTFENGFTAFFNGLRPKMKNAMVLVGPHQRVPFQETPPAKRRTDESVKQAIEKRCGERWIIGRCGRPLRECQVAGEDHVAAFVSFVDVKELFASSWPNGR